MNKNINWGIRIKNPQFVVTIALAMFTNLMAMSGLQLSDLNTWSAFLDVIVNGLSNPFFFINTLFIGYLAVVDFTTEGFSDSIRALAYNKPAKNSKK